MTGPAGESRAHGCVTGLSLTPSPGAANAAADALEVAWRGIAGDCHGDRGGRQVSLMDAEIARALAEGLGLPDTPGTHKANITVSGLHGMGLQLLDHLQLGEVEVQVARRTANYGRGSGKAGSGPSSASGHYAVCDWGVFARVCQPGTVRLGAPAIHIPKVMRVHVITLSDRASAGAYPDKSGPALQAMIEGHCPRLPWPCEVARSVIPDERDALENLLVAGRRLGIDVIFTTGGTGPGPRDITPETVESSADKMLPGIMEHIRVKFGAGNSKALLSRGVAAVLGRTLVFTLPGSVRGAEEYAGEILGLLEHLILVVNGVDPH